MAGSTSAEVWLDQRRWDALEEALKSLSAQELRRLLKTLKKPDHDHLHLLLKAAPDRIHTLIPGLLVLDTVAQAYQLQEILVSSCGVREGYLHHRVLKGEAG